MGYGYASPANFRKSDQLDNITGSTYNGHDGSSPVMVYEFGNSKNDINITPVAKRTHVNKINRPKSQPPMKIKTISSKEWVFLLTRPRSSVFVLSLKKP